MTLFLLQVFAFEQGLRFLLCCTPLESGILVQHLGCHANTFKRSVCTLELVPSGTSHHGRGCPWCYFVSPPLDPGAEIVFTLNAFTNNAMKSSCDRDRGRTQKIAAVLVRVCSGPATSDCTQPSLLCAHGLSTQVPPDVPSCVRVTEQKIRAMVCEVLFEKSHHTGSVNGT